MANLIKVELKIAIHWIMLSDFRKTNLWVRTSNTCTMYCKYNSIFFTEETQLENDKEYRFVYKN